MGILKHAILPIFSLLNAALTYKFLIEEDFSLMPLERDDFDSLPATSMERHLIHVLGGTFLCFFVNCLAAIFYENSHYRGMVVGLQTLFFVVDGYSYFSLGADIPPVIYAMLCIGGGGLLIHSKEPGIFTKDKGAGKSKTG